MKVLPWIVILVGLGLAAPCLTADFTADDHLHRVVQREDAGIAGLRSRPMDLFVFADGDPRTNAELRDGGLFPWWTAPDLKLAFFRPITSATHAIDHLLWPDSAPAQLAHNLVWRAIVLVLVWGFYRRFIAMRWIAVLALALYALDDARGPVVGWIATRSALVALACALPAAVPVATTVPADRLLSVSGRGAMGLVAQFLAAAARDRAMLGDGKPRRIFAPVVAVLLLVIHGVLAPPLLVARSRSMVAVARVIDRAAAGIPSDPSIADKFVVILAAPSDALAGYVPIMRASRLQPRPAHLYWLATAPSAVPVTRVDDHTLHVTTQDGMLRYEVDQMMRSPRLRPFRAGDRVALTGVTVEVTAVTRAGRPQDITVYFDKPLDV